MALLPDDLENHPTFVQSDIFGGVMASQTWEHFFEHPVSGLGWPHPLVY